jgi:hypothetical protein
MMLKLALVEAEKAEVKAQTCDIAWFQTSQRCGTLPNDERHQAPPPFISSRMQELSSLTNSPSLIQNLAHWGPP